MHVLVEGFQPDAVALAGHLRGRGAEVVLAGQGEAPDAAAALHERGVRVVSHADLDADPGAPEVAYLDVWTPEVAPRVRHWRAAGTRLSCLSDLLVGRHGAMTVGVTGTAGKSTTAAYVTQLLRAAGLPVVASTTARSGNLWATDELVSMLDEQARPDILVLELTSSHLAFCASSPRVAIVTSFWPDHVELHGSVAAYRRAKETIVRHQLASDAIVVMVDDPDVARFAGLTPARRWDVSRVGPVEHGVGVDDGIVTVYDECGAVQVGPAGPRGARLDATLLATAGALAAGAEPTRLAGAIEALEPPLHRATVVGRHSGAMLVDDSMATTPTKGATTLAGFRERSVVVVAGGELESAGRRVHSSPEEVALLEAASVVLRRAARAVVGFGPAGVACAELWGADVVVDSIDEAIERSLALCTGASAVVVSPMFPVAPADRDRVPRLLLLDG